MCDIRICTWNANEIRHKTCELIEFLNRIKVDIMLINETKLSAKDSYKIRNYTSERYNRDNAAGGVMILIKNNIPYKLIKIKHSVVENVCIKLANDMHIIAAYNRPSIQYTTKDLDNLSNVSDKVLLVGDLNSKHKAWNCHVNNANGRTLYSYSQKNNCSIVFPDEPTHYPENGGTPTTIDIIINKKIRNTIEPIVLNELNSDHRPILFTVGQVKHNNTYEQEVYKYKKADWNKFRSILDSKIVINYKIYTKQNIDQEVSKFTNSLELALRQTVSKAKRKREEEKLPEEILDLIKLRNRNRRIWQKTRNPAYRDTYKKQIKMIKTKIINYRNEVWRKKLTKLNIYDRSLWKMTKIFKKKFQPIPTLEDNNIEAFLDKDKAEMIATQYEKVHNTNLENNNEQKKVIRIVEDLKKNKVENIEDFKHVVTSPKEISDIIKKLPSLKAPGKDGIQNIVLKNISRKALVQLMYIINAIIKLGYFPQE